MVHTTQNLKTLNLTLDLEIHQHLRSPKHVINIIMWIRDTGCYRMDQVWMYDLARIDPVYIENVHHFVEEAMRHVNREKKSDIFYPYVDCDNKIA
jgi:hypothetical protein